MNQSAILTVTISGAIGSRFWPLSRPSYLKQFTAIEGNSSLFQATAEQIRALLAGKSQVCRTSSKSLSSLRLRDGLNTSCTEKFIVPGVDTIRSIMASVVRLSGLRSNWKRSCRYRCITTWQSTGLWRLVLPQFNEMKKRC